MPRVPKRALARGWGPIEVAKSWVVKARVSVPAPVIVAAGPEVWVQA